MLFNLWTKYGSQNSKPVFEAFKKGAERLGHQCTENSKGDVDVIWSVLWKGRMAPNKNIFTNKTIVLEVGALKRNVTWRMGVGGIDSRAYFGDGLIDNKRLNKLGIELKSWQTNRKDDIIICCQNQNSFQWQDQPPLEKWLDITIKDIRSYTDRNICIRPHPRSPISQFDEKKYKNVSLEIPKKIQGTYDDFNFDPFNYWTVVNHSSNPGIQAAICGIPVFVDKRNLAFPVGNLEFSTIETPVMPDREEWAKNISHIEWTTDEIQTGQPIERLTNFDFYSNIEKY